MITKNDWNAALDAWVIAERERLGGPPSPEQVVAYRGGTLAGPEAARVRARLVYYPELTELLTDVPPRSFRHLLPVAAALIVALFGILLVESRREFARKTSEPYAHESRHELRSPRTRGAGGSASAPVYALPAGEERYVLVMHVGTADDHGYTVKIVDAAGKEVWRKDGVHPIAGAIEITVPRKFLGEGVHRLDVSEHGQLVESVPIRVTPQRRANGVQTIDP